MTSPDAKYGFNDLAHGRIRASLGSSDTSFELIKGNVYPFLPGWASSKELLTTFRGPDGSLEIIKIIDIIGNILTVERGQDGTVARNWPPGTLLTQRSVANSLGRFIQKGEFRTIDYNPNGVLVPEYPNEKVYQSGDTCHRRWWVHALDNKWRLVVGDKCDDEYWDNGWLWQLLLQQLFAFGGSNDPDATDQYDPDNDTWAEKTNLGGDRYGAAAACPGASDGINVFGGGTATNAGDTRDNVLWGTGLSYSTKTDMPPPPRQAHMAVGTYGDHAYCFGGKDFSGPTVLSDNDQYSEDGDSWVGKQAVPSPARMAGGAGRPYLGEIYYAGGDQSSYSMGQATGDHDEYNEVGDSWTGKTDLTPARSDFSGACDVDYFYVAYGRDNVSMCAEFDYFYPTGNSWTALADGPDFSHYQVHGCGQDSSSSATYHVGGDQDGFENTTREYFFGWSFKTNCPNPKGYFTMAQSLGFDGLGE